MAAFLYPKTKQIYTPNTDKSATMGESGLQSQASDDTIGMRINLLHDRLGRFACAPDRGGGIGGGSGSAEASGGGSGSTKPAGGAATRSSKRRKSLRVSDQETAIIAESISRNYDMRFKKYAGKGTCEVQTANYNYVVQVHGRFSFTIIRRMRIK